MTIQEETLRQLAQKIDDVLEMAYEQKMGFFLTVAPFNADAGISDYIGNSDRETAIKWMRETADRLEKNQTIPATKGNS